jgi:hypothetical protein
MSAALTAVVALVADFDAADAELNYALSDRYALDASLDYRFRDYDNPDSRNDYSVFTTCSLRLDPNNQLTFGADVRRRRYPEGRLRDRSRTTDEALAGWYGSSRATGRSGRRCCTCATRAPAPRNSLSPSADLLPGAASGRSWCFS